MEEIVIMRELYEKKGECSIENYTKEMKERNIKSLIRQIKDLDIFLEICRERELSGYTLMTLISIKNLKEERLRHLEMSYFE